ncbi:MAG: hypothetical protein M1834_007774 [Cirrosporium novae-zelandiae]|nr:MAG: hypothetical protein M1834_007774 [Cirrosporium novae-zelandiae]
MGACFSKAGGVGYYEKYMKEEYLARDLNQQQQQQQQQQQRHSHTPPPSLPPLPLPPAVIAAHPALPELYQSRNHTYEVIRYLHRAEDGAFNEGIALVQRKGNAERRCIMKKLNLTPSKPGLDLRQEIEIMKRLRHRNIVGFVDESYSGGGGGGMGYLFMELCDRGSLYGLWSNYVDKGELIPEGFLWHVFKSLVGAICYIHHGIREGQEIPSPDSRKHWESIIHRDIKPDNVMLKSRVGGEYPSVKLGDFGLAISAAELQVRQMRGEGCCGTMAFAPPESENGFKGDVWSLGATIRYICMPKDQRGRWEYSLELQMAVDYCFLQKNNRPYAHQLSRIVANQGDIWKHKYPNSTDIPLPSWAFQNVS